nr:hypothetical protein [uncultured Pseudomonas sp.]
MNDPQHFLAQLKKAQLSRQNKQVSQVATKVATVVSTSTPTKNKTKLTEEQYRNILVAKAIIYIRGQL